MEHMQLIILGTYLRELGVDTPVGPDERIALQKAIYLLLICGEDLGYRYKWDLRGPYSSGLTVHAKRYFEIAEEKEVATIVKTLRFKSDVLDRIRRVRDLMKPPGTQVPVVYMAWLELIVSLHYLAHMKYEETIQQDPEGVFDPLRQELIKLKPHLREYEGLARNAWDRLAPILSAEAR